MSAVALRDEPDGPALVYGMPVSKRNAIWLEILASSVLHRHISLLGHVAGALAGVLWTLMPSRRIRMGGRAHRFHGGGRVGGGGARTTYAPVD